MYPNLALHESPAQTYLPQCINCTASYNIIANTQGAGIALFSAFNTTVAHNTLWLTAQSQMPSILLDLVQVPRPRPSFRCPPPLRHIRVLASCCVHFLSLSVFWSICWYRGISFFVCTSCDLCSP